MFNFDADGSPKSSIRSRFNANLAVDRSNQVQFHYFSLCALCVLYVLCVKAFREQLLVLMRLPCNATYPYCPPAWRVLY